MTYHYALHLILIWLCLKSQLSIRYIYLAKQAFPEQPYQGLVKNYRLGAETSFNDPLVDAKLALSLLSGSVPGTAGAACRVRPVIFLLLRNFAENDRVTGPAVRSLLVIRADSINATTAFDLFKTVTQNQVCKTSFNKVIPAYLANPALRPALAYCLAWLRVARAKHRY